MVISTSIARDLVKRTLLPSISEKKELFLARAAAGGAVVVAGYFGVNPPGFVAQTVAFAFGLAAASFFPAILLGIFSKTMNKQGAVSGMVAGILFTASYIIYFTFMNPELNSPENWWFGISPEGIGTLGMMINLVTAVIVSRFTKNPPEHIREMIETIRVPRNLDAGTGKKPNQTD